MGKKWKGERWKGLVSWKLAATVNLKELTPNTISWWYTFGNFTLSNSVILVEDQIGWKKGHEIFLIDACAGNIGNKNIASKYKTILVPMSSIIY